MTFIDRAPEGDCDTLDFGTREARPEASHPMRRTRPESVIGPLGQPLTLANLPPRDTRRWIAHRKAELVAAVDGGLVTIDEVCEWYCIELEEFVSWQRGVERLGLRGLWITRSQKHRDLFERRDRY